MSLHQLAEQPPVPWCRQGQYGEGGTTGFEIDSSGLETRNRFMYRDAVPVIPLVSYLVRIRLLSTLVASNNGFEGVAVRMRGFRLNGSSPENITEEQVWDSNPELGGRSRWFSRQTSGYETISFVIEEMPEGMDFVTVELVVRATSGQIRLHNIECRHLFQRQYPWVLPNVSNVSSAAFFYEQIPVIQRDGATTLTAAGSGFVHYMTTVECNIIKGEMIEIDGTGFITGFMYDLAQSTATSFRTIESSLSVSFKFRVRGEDRFHTVAAGTSTGRQVYLRQPLKVREEALANYDQYQVVLVAVPQDENQSVNGLAHSYIRRLVEVNVRALDFIKPSQ